MTRASPTRGATTHGRGPHAQRGLRSLHVREEHKGESPPLRNLSAAHTLCGARSALERGTRGAEAREKRPSKARATPKWSLGNNRDQSLREIQLHGEVERGVDDRRGLGGNRRNAVCCHKPATHPVGPRHNPNKDMPWRRSGKPPTRALTARAGPQLKWSIKVETHSRRLVAIRRHESAFRRCIVDRQPKIRRWFVDAWRLVDDEASMADETT